MEALGLTIGAHVLFSDDGRLCVRYSARTATSLRERIVGQIAKTEPARPEPLVPLLGYQREDIESDARFRWNCWSRQTGKSFTKSLRRILRGLARNRTQVFLSAGERQSRELMAKARQHCEALKIATDYYDGRFFKDLGIRQLEIALPGGDKSL